MQILGLKTPTLENSKAKITF